MAKRNRTITKEKLDRWIKQGRGNGEGVAYKPWLFIQDVASRGRCHRIKGWKHGRVHHLLSNLESYVFYIYDWSQRVIEIKEQFPLLPLEETLSIADEIGVPHPSDPATKRPAVMSTDFILKVSRGLSLDYFARQVKYEASLSGYRTQEKLEIERRYWLNRNIDYGIITERDIHMPLVRNIQWIHSRYYLSDLFPLSAQRVREIAGNLSDMVLHDNAPLTKLTSACDSHFGLRGGDSLKVVRHLIAIRYWQVDMSKPIKPRQRLELLNLPKQKLYEEERFIA